MVEVNQIGINHSLGRPRELINLERISVSSSNQMNRDQTQAKTPIFPNWPKFNNDNLQYTC